MRGRFIAYAVGGALIALGLWGIVGKSDPYGWLLWFGGAVVLHDAVLAPAVLLIGALTPRLPGSVRAGLVVAGSVTLVAIPMVLGFGRRADNPSQLPLPYGRNLLIVLAVIAVAAALPPLWRGFSKRRASRADPK